MAANQANATTDLGFLTVTDHPQHGLFGGYLVLNAAGRPLEFHCTAPIKPNRAQQILYGPTLEGFLYGEQIGRTLLEKAKIEPLLVFTDCRPALALGEFISLPVALVLSGEDRSAADQHEKISLDNQPPANQREKIVRLDAAHPGGPRLVAFRLGRNRLALPERSDDQRRLIAEQLGELAESFDLAEPFTRIREAIEEAQRAVR